VPEHFRCKPPIDGQPHEQDQEQIVGRRPRTYFFGKASRRALAQIDETFAPEAMEKIASWILAVR
jgi:hypothetical protein